MRRSDLRRLCRLLVVGGAAAFLVAASACSSDDEDQRQAVARPACVHEPASPAVAPPPASALSRRPIFFWREHPWPSLWSVRADGSQLRQIYRTPQNAKRPRLSPDRQWIAFDGASPGKPPLTDFDLQIVRVDGTQRKTLAESDEWELDAAWSPDGTRLSFSRWEPTGGGDDYLRSQIWVVGVDGTGPIRLGRGRGARWSPNGKLLVFAAPTAGSDGDLFVMNADGGARCRLFATPDVEEPAGWSPDGRKILFTRYGPDGADVFVTNVDGTGVRNLTRSPGFDIAASWSPDSSKILFTVGQTGSAELLLIDVDGTNLRSISGDRFGGSDPSWH